jgi:hypothetical protein
MLPSVHLPSVQPPLKNDIFMRMAKRNLRANYLLLAATRDHIVATQNRI